MECKNSALLIFDKPGVLTDVQRSRFVDYYPVSSPSSGGPIEFVIGKSSEEYINLSNTSLYVSFKVVHEDGTAVVQADDVVGLNNLSISTLFSDASLKLADTQIEGGTSDYSYRGYFRNVMQFTPDAQNSTMQAMGWYKDEAGKFDDASNKGFVKRQALVGDSQTIELYGPVFFDFFNQDRHLISDVGLRIKLTPNKPEFLLNSYSTKAAKKYKVIFNEVILYVERLEMNPSVINGHAVGMKTQNAHYFINHTNLLTYTIPKGQKSYTKDNLFMDSSPKMLMIAMVDNDAFNGNLSKNPFNFEHYNLNKLVLYRDGRCVPGVPFKPDFASKLYLRSYINTMRAFNYWNTDDTNGLMPSEWGAGYTIYAFDLTPDREVSSACIHAHTGNNFRLELNFAKALAETINVLIYSITDSQIEITQLRDVITHYNR